MCAFNYFMALCCAGCFWGLVIILVITAAPHLGAAYNGLPEENLQFSFRSPGADVSAADSCCPFIPTPANHTGGKRPPALIGIGAEKCGSAYLAGLLSLHPQLQKPDYEELQFLDQNIKNASLDDALALYLDRWKANSQMPLSTGDNTEDVIQFEITPNYIYVSRIFHPKTVLALPPLHSLLSCIQGVNCDFSIDPVDLLS